MFEMFGV